jgi:hypothetical protein
MFGWLHQWTSLTQYTNVVANMAAARREPHHTARGSSGAMLGLQKNFYFLPFSYWFESSHTVILKNKLLVLNFYFFFKCVIFANLCHHFWVVC